MLSYILVTIWAERTSGNPWLEPREAVMISAPSSKALMKAKAIMSSVVPSEHPKTL